MVARTKDISGDKKRIGTTLADRADRHELYEESVQNVEDECSFISQTFQKLRGREPTLLREDFCGTGSAACYWTRLGKDHRSIGVDLDGEVLEWGRRNRLKRLSPQQQERVTLIQSDVMSVQIEAVDAVCALNFSYWIFKKRPLLREYFQKVYAALKADGVFFLDAFGGYEASEESKEKTKYDHFTYVWDQAHFYPVTGEMICHIHFRFPDKSKLKKAFTYDWRLWTLPELTEVLEEAGFAKSTVYWEGTDEDGDGDGEFTPEAKGEADAGWIAYIVAEK